MNWLDLVVAFAAGLLVGLVVALLVAEGGPQIDALTVSPEGPTDKEE